MDFKDFIAGINDNDRRIDKIVRVFASELSLSEIYKALRKGLIKINHKKCKAEDHVFEGDVISIAAVLLNKAAVKTPENAVSINQNKEDLDIVFENQHILIINKPYDIAVHGTQDSLEKKVLQYYKSNKKDTSLSFFPGPVHRIDRKTTGLVAFSFSLEGAHWFAENIKYHNIKKIYYGIIEGKINQNECWEDEITENTDSDNSHFHTVKASEGGDSGAGKKAKTYVRLISEGTYKNRPVSFVEFNIVTGRKHQIRAQSALHHCPLLGDTAYGAAKTDNPQEYYLQASKLLIPENPIGLPGEIKIPLSDEFIKLLNYCGIKKTGV